MSPTYEVEPRFWRDFDRLTAATQRQFLAARQLFIEGLRENPPRKGPWDGNGRPARRPPLYKLHAPSNRATLAQVHAESIVIAETRRAAVKLNPNDCA